MTMIKIDLNNRTFTLDDVRQLIASKDDSVDRQLRVTDDGLAYISDITGAEHKDGLSFRLNTWDAGDKYTGQKASLDNAWVKKIHEILMKNWPTPSSPYIEIY